MDKKALKEKMEQLETMLQEMREAQQEKDPAAAHPKPAMADLDEPDEPDELDVLDELADLGDAPISSNAKVIRLSVWLTAILLIAVQVVFLKYWTILTGLLTCALALFVAESLVRLKTIGKMLQIIVRQHMLEIVVWTLAIVAIVVEAFVWKWWTCLTGIVTLFVAYLLTGVLPYIWAYFNGELDN